MTRHDLMLRYLEHFVNRRSGSKKTKQSESNRDVHEQFAPPSPACQQATKADQQTKPCRNQSSRMLPPCRDISDETEQHEQATKKDCHVRHQSITPTVRIVAHRCNAERICFTCSASGCAIDTAMAFCGGSSVASWLSRMAGEAKCPTRFASRSWSNEA